MRKLVMGCAMMGLIALSPKSEARPPALLRALYTHHRSPYGEVGVASWYGIEHQGLPTASGELFDKDRLTAAHRELPFGTKVRVTNLQNLESTVLKINDRGPSIEGRVIDLSLAAANRLGFLEAGLAPVEIDVLSYPKGWNRHTTAWHSPRAN